MHLAQVPTSKPAFGNGQTRNQDHLIDDRTTPRTLYLVLVCTCLVHAHPRVICCDVCIGLLIFTKGSQAKPHEGQRHSAYFSRRKR